MKTAVTLGHPVYSTWSDQQLSVRRERGPPDKRHQGIIQKQSLFLLRILKGAECIRQPWKRTIYRKIW